MICEAGAKAEVIEEHPGDKYSPSGLLPGFTAAGRPLHFQVSLAGSDATKIITIYEPDPNEWIENRKRRQPCLMARSAAITPRNRNWWSSTSKADGCWWKKFPRRCARIAAKPLARGKRP